MLKVSSDDVFSLKETLKCSDALTVDEVKEIIKAFTAGQLTYEEVSQFGNGKTIYEQV